jgi:hypothetical protein
MAELSRGQINELVAGFAARNPSYREALLRDPRRVIEKQFNMHLPDGLTVKAVAETSDTVYVVVPFVPKTGQELSDDALELVAGGFKDNNCNNARGGINTHVEVKLV